MILVGGRVYTAADTQTFVEAVAIRGTRILAVGSNQKISALAGANTRRIDVGGRLVIPGINDGHIHTPLTPKGVDVRFKNWPPSWQEVQVGLTKAVSSAPKGTFVFAGIDTTILDSAVNRKALDELAPEHPVVLSGPSGHSTTLNTAAMKRFGLKEDEPDPMGGRFVRSSDGTLTGLVFEYAAFRVQRVFSSLATNRTPVEDFRNFSNRAARLGITSVQDMALIAPQQFVSILEQAQPSIRVRVIRFPLTDAHNRITEEWRSLPRTPSPNVTVSGTKYVLDGNPMERSGAMRQPYADDPKTSGWMDFTGKDMESMLRESLRDDDPLLVHIVGDRTAVAFLNAMEATGGAAVWSKRRVRIEHGGGIMPDLLPRVKQLGIVVVQNPTHFNMRDLFLSRFGPERTEQLQPLRSLLDAGIPVALGSDGPLNPYLNIMYASNVPGKPKESLTREQALVAYTRTSAYAEFAEKDKGTLEPGKFADLAVLSQDIFKIPSGDLPKTESILTLVGGKVVHSSGALAEK
jgi:predicted amidohydrolase YtcJ